MPEHGPLLHNNLTFIKSDKTHKVILSYPPTSKVSREVANPSKWLYYIFYLILHIPKQTNSFKKGLRVWLPGLFLSACFDVFREKSQFLTK